MSGSENLLQTAALGWQSTGLGWAGKGSCPGTTYTDWMLSLRRAGCSRPFTRRRTTALRTGRVWELVRVRMPGGSLMLEVGMVGARWGSLVPCSVAEEDRTVGGGRLEFDCTSSALELCRKDLGGLATGCDFCFPKRFAGPEKVKDLLEKADKVY